jgi:hypothetical protein
MTSDEVTRELWSQAEETALGGGYHFSDRCAVLLKDFIAQAAPKFTDKPDSISKAKADIARYVRLMMDYKLTLPMTSPPDMTLGENTFFTVRAKFCPCFPFC